jgi:hypothetical protein
VPQPDPNEEWGAIQVRDGDSDQTATQVEVAAGLRPADVAASATAREHGGHLISGCTFADRCPYVMDVCRQEVPPLFRVDPYRAASCFLLRGRGAELPTEQLDVIMSPHPTAGVQA